MGEKPMGIAIATQPRLFSFENRWPSLPCVRPLVCAVGLGFAVNRCLESEALRSGWEVETFHSLAAFLSRSPYLGPSCLILNVAFIGREDLQKCFELNLPAMSLVLVSAFGQVLMMVAAVRAGIGNHVEIPLENCGLPNIVRNAIASSSSVLVCEEKVKVLRDCYLSLSSRERDVMGLVCAGLLNKQIGHELGISEITVKVHRGAVMRKMKAQSLAELVKMSTTLAL
jgi:FixJ family two-component response regulator